eukprot:scaffold218321_cov28-Tisochrysis_lutea.AAC.5
MANRDGAQRGAAACAEKKLRTAKGGGGMAANEQPANECVSPLAGGTRYSGHQQADAAST